MGGGTCLWVAEPGSAQSGTLGGAPGACAHNREAAASSSMSGKVFIDTQISIWQAWACDGGYNNAMRSGNLLIAALVVAVAAPILMAQTPGGTARPPILGVAHIQLKTNDLAAARNFYGRYLGFQEPFGLDSLAVFK